MSSHPFTKVFSSLLDSTLWIEQPPHVKLVWIAMMAMADREGYVASSIPGLARRAVVTTPQAEEALEVFLSPDKYSRTPDHEGRRIKAVAGGWVLLNHAKYRKRISEEINRERASERQREYRARDSEVSGEVGDHFATKSLQSVTERDASASLSVSGSDQSLAGPDPEQPPCQPPDVPGLERVAHPGPLQPSKRDRAQDAAAEALSATPALRHRFDPGWDPSPEHRARGRELGLTDEEMLERAEDCRRKPIKHGFLTEDDHFFRELGWLARDKQTAAFKRLSKRERDAFEMPGRERTRA